MTNDRYFIKPRTQEEKPRNFYIGRDGRYYATLQALELANEAWKRSNLAELNPSNKIPSLKLQSCREH